MQNQIVQHNHEKIFMDNLITEIPRTSRVVVLAPHPDDEVFSCAGLLSLLRQQGAEISLQILTDGSRGGDNSAGSLVATRMQESQHAAALLGLPAPVFWGIEDGCLAAEERLAQRLHALLVETDVDLVIAPALTELHPDHQALAFAALAAVVSTGGTCRAAFYELNMALPAPNLFIDITSLIGEKRAAMTCFVSQLKEQPYLERIDGLNRYRSYFLGTQTSHAEAFFFADAASLAENPLLMLEGSLARAYRGWQLQYPQQIPSTDADELCAELSALYSSRSWKVTAPLRTVRRMFNTLKTRLM